MVAHTPEGRPGPGVPGVTYVLLARVPATGVAQFEAYEQQVLPLLAQHGGRLDRRLRSTDRRTEVHLVWFPSAHAFAAYRDDPRRVRHRGLLIASGAATELFELDDVTVDGRPAATAHGDDSSPAGSRPG